MKSLILCVLALSFNLTAHAAIKPLPLQEILKNFQAILPPASPVQMEVYNFHPPCSTSDYAYFLKFQLPGVSQDKAMKLDFLLATLNAEQMAKIYSEVKKNYPTRGLPECMKNDLTIMYFFDEKNGEARFEPVDRTTERCDGMEVRRPVTSCVDVAEIYPAAP